MNVIQAVVLGVVEGLTEFLPVSSTGHLLISEHLMGLSGTKDKDSLIGFTAVIQTGAIFAAVLYFLREIVTVVGDFGSGLVSAGKRQTDGFRYALAVGIGCLPIIAVGFAAKDAIKSIDEHLLAVAIGLIAFSAVFVVAEKRATLARGKDAIGPMDGLVVGLAQCIALVPGVSRSGASISAGLLRGLDRVAATRFSFLIGIPALLGAGVLGLGDASKNTVGTTNTAIATVVAFVVGYASIAFLLRLVASHRITAFVPYRLLVGVGVLIGVALS